MSGWILWIDAVPIALHHVGAAGIDVDRVGVLALRGEDIDPGHLCPGARGVSFCLHREDKRAVEMDA